MKSRLRGPLARLRRGHWPFAMIPIPTKQSNHPLLTQKARSVFVVNAPMSNRRPPNEVAIFVDPSSFSPREVGFIKSVVTDTERGWRVVFPDTDLVIADPPFLSRARAESRRPLADVLVCMKPNSTVKRWFPSMDGYSFTLRRADHPVTLVVLNQDNWRSVPVDSYFAPHQLDEYRTYLVNHELGHAVFRLDHRNEPVPHHPFASIMGQQTKQRQWDPRRKCEPNPFPAQSPECEPALRVKWNRW